MAQEVAPLFKPFRALGYITENVPFTVSRRGKENFVTVSVGKAWQVYNCAKLTLALVGPQLNGDIRALACKNDLTFAAVGGDIIECKRVHRSGAYRGAHPGAPIRALLIVGDVLLSLSGAEREQRLAVWTVGQYDKPQRVLDFGPDFTPTCICHPDTYLNKVLIGSEQGSMRLVNVRTGATLYSFAGWGSPVRCLASSPALDVVGAGLGDGRAVMHNIRFDEEIVTFANAAGAGLGAEGLLGGGAGTAAAAAGGACSALSFRSGAGLPLLAAGGGAGVVTVWNLEERRLHTVIRDAHGDSLLSLHFFVGEPLLMSAGADNAVKHWLFDGADAQPRLLRFRAGHGAPPSLLRHYGPGGLRLLSAGCDRSFRVFSTIQDQQSRELSQGHTKARAKRLKLKEEELKLERAVDMDACELRERDWANVITAHEGDPSAYTWRLAAFSLGDHVLTPPKEELAGAPAAPVTCVGLSRCGNFGLVGSAAGRLDRYNMQSGLHRGAYYRKRPQPLPLGQQGRSAALAAAGVPAHGGAVVGCAADAANRLLVSAGLDGALRVWDFRTQACRAEVALGCPASRLALHPDSGLAAVALADASLRVYDIAVPRLVRRFRGHSDRVTGLTLSADSRWLLSSAMDGTLRVWDIPVAQCLQVLKLGSPITALSLSPSLDFLATAHVNRRGIYLWANQAVFGDASAIPHSERPVSAAAVAASVVRVRLPGVGRQRGSGRGKEGKEEGRQAGEADADADMAVEDTDHEDEDGFSEDEEAEEAARAAAAAGAGPPAPAPLPRPYEAVHPLSRAPLPLAPRLVTLSLLPAATVESLAHIEVIKERNKPLAPPKKPEAAPFFLPTLPGLAPTPVFDLGAAGGKGHKGKQGEGAAGAGPAAAGTGAQGEGADGQQLAGWGDGEEEGEGDEPASGSGGEEEEEGGRRGGSRVLRLGRGGRAGGKGGGGGGAPVSPLVAALRTAEAEGEYGGVMALLRGMSPVAIDREIRSMQVLPGASDEAEAAGDLAALLDCLAASIEARQDWEFCQALLRVVLAQHGDTIAARPELASRAAQLRDGVAAGWRRLGGLLDHTRALVGYFAGAQA